jgi:hypothetical protein
LALATLDAVRDTESVESTKFVERSAIKKVAIRLVSFVALRLFINYVDRMAIRFAAPSGMNQDLGLSAAQFGFASGVFFIGYILLKVPSNLALHRYGARRWLHESWSLRRSWWASSPGSIWSTRPRRRSG